MGRSPTTTPVSEKHYFDRNGEKHERGKSLENHIETATDGLTVEISEPGQPTFLPSVRILLQ
jgi:hypothetical protein